MRSILITYAIILTLGISSMVTNNQYLANIAGFIAAVGFMFIFLKTGPIKKPNKRLKSVAIGTLYFQQVFSLVYYLAASGTTK